MFDTIGRYSIEEERGEGSSSTVFRAFDQDRERHVALKLLHPHVVGEAVGDVLAELRRSAEGASVLSHPHLTKVLDVGAEDAFFFVCTEFVDGLSTYEIMARHGAFPVPRAIRLVMDVLDALDYAHAQGVVHGDVKPENVMVDQEGKGVLTDFGMYREASPESRFGAMEGAGAVAMPPEAILGHELDVRSDLYGVGVLLFELVTGTAAFPVEEGEDPYELSRRRIEEPPPRAADHLPEGGEELDEVLRIALARDPDARFQTAEEMARALSSLTGKLGVDLPEPVPLVRLPEALVGEREEAAAVLREVAATRGAAPPPLVEPGQSLALRRGAGWTSVAVPALMIVTVWGLLLFRVGYLSVSSFPPGANVYRVDAGVEPATAEEAVEVGRLAGVTPLAFRRRLAGERRLVLVWPGRARPPRVVDVLVPARGHVQVNLGEAGPPSTRTTRVFPTLASLLRGLFEAEGTDGEEGDFRPQAPEVDPQGDQHLLEHRLEDAVRVYEGVVDRDERAARRAADRLVEAALYNKTHDPGWAARALEEALRFDRDHAFGHAILAEIQHAQGVGDPLHHLRKAAERHIPGEPADLPMDDPGQALAEVRKRLATGQDTPLLRRYEAFLLMRIGQRQAALEKFLALARDKGWTSRFR